MPCHQCLPDAHACVKARLPECAGDFSRCGCPCHLPAPLPRPVHDDEIAAGVRRLLRECDEAVAWEHTFPAQRREAELIAAAVRKACGL